MTSAQIRRQLARLDEYLLDAYEPRELVRLIDRLFGPTTTADLPHAADSAREFVFAAVRVLARRGLVDGGLLRALIADRPHRTAELRRLAGLLGVTLHVDVQQAETVVWRGDDSAVRLRWVAELEKHLLARERLGFDDAARPAIERSIEGLARRLRAAAPIAVGSVVASTRLEGVLGAGSFGTVWRARHVETNRTVATKIFNTDHLAQGIMLWRFRRSVRALQTLNAYRGAPPSIPSILAVSADSLAFVMPLFPEGTLESVARRGWSLDTKIDVFLQVCRAVDFAHRVGVIHRDIKPANVLLDEARRPVLVDYDIADISFVTELSIAEGGLGTPVFAAPEQLESAELADERSDVYSLGRLLHYLLIERSPGYQIERDPALENLRGHHPALIAAIRRATQWEPKRRHAAVWQLIADVERYRTGVAAVRARCSGGWRWVRHHAALLTTCATMTGASTLVAVQERQIAAKNLQVIEMAKDRLSQSEAVLERLRAGVESYDKVHSEVLRLGRELEQVSRRPELLRAGPELRQELVEASKTMSALTDRLSRVGTQLTFDVGSVAGYQEELRRTLEDETPRPPAPATERRVLREVIPPVFAAVADTAPAVRTVASGGKPVAGGDALGPGEDAERTTPKSPRKAGRTKARGDRPHASLRSKMDRVRDRLLSCFTTRFDDTTAILSITVHINRGGTVDDVRLVRPVDANARRCIEDIVKRIHFGVASHPDRYEYELVGKHV